MKHTLRSCPKDRLAGGSLCSCPTAHRRRGRPICIRSTKVLIPLLFLEFQRHHCFFFFLPSSSPIYRRVLLHPFRCNVHCRFLASGPPQPETVVSRGRTLGGAAQSTGGGSAGRDAAVARSLSSDSTDSGSTDAAAAADIATAADEPGRNSKRDASSKDRPQLSPETIKRRRESERAKRLARFANPKKVIGTPRVCVSAYLRVLLQCGCAVVRLTCAVVRLCGCVLPLCFCTNFVTSRTALANSSFMLTRQFRFLPPRSSLPACFFPCLFIFWLWRAIEIRARAASCWR